MVAADHTEKAKGGRMYVYFKESLPGRCLPNSYLKECLIPEVVY